jgi:hypothetical protein
LANSLIVGQKKLSWHYRRARQPVERNARHKSTRRYTQNLWIGAGVRSAAYPPGCQGPETAERPSRERYAAC